ncbi:MAG: hypothetical protein GDA40_01880 [Rhodobacteraceae bacterium]|nr:hypothetical protein [Paracoccaceae bacterium]
MPWVPWGGYDAIAWGQGMRGVEATSLLMRSKTGSVRQMRYRAPIETL